MGKGKKEKKEETKTAQNYLAAPGEGRTKAASHWRYSHALALLAERSHRISFAITARVGYSVVNEIFRTTML